MIYYLNMNSDLTPAQNVGSTDNPQGAQGAPLDNDASSFQKSAGTDALSQNRPISVITTGKPVTGTNVAATGMSGATILFIIVALITLLIVVSFIFRRVKKQPEPVKTEAKLDADSKPETKRPNKVVRPQSKKKLPRSKRHK